MPSIAALAEEHRIIEAELDQFAAGLAAGSVDGGHLRRLTGLIVSHYDREEPFLASLRRHEPRYADKLAEQHEEVLEIAERLEESLAAGEADDAAYLARRFLAMARHNMIEEERDAFPLAER